MKTILKLSLAAVAIASLAACGGGDSSDPADKFLGNWKSRCYLNAGNDGNTYHYTTLWTGAKVSAGAVAFTGTYSSYSDSQCTNKLATFTATPRQMNIGAETTFLGAKAEAIVYTTPSTGEALPGFATADAGTFNFVTYTPTPGTALPGGWGKSSPWAKQ